MPILRQLRLVLILWLVIPIPRGISEPQRPSTSTNRVSIPEAPSKQELTTSLRLLAEMLNNWQVYRQSLEIPEHANAHGIAIRLVAASAGLLAATVDLHVSSILAATYWLLGDSASSQAHLSYIPRALRSIPGSLFALWQPEIVSRHFIREQHDPQKFGPYGKFFQPQPFDIRYPESAADIVAVVREAAQKGKSVSVVGAGLSQGGHAVPTDRNHILVDTRKMKQITVNIQERTATIAAGAVWNDLKEALNTKGLAIRVMQASAGFSIAGSVFGANAHGWDYHSGTLAETLKSFTLVDAQGNLSTVSPEDELFGLVVGGYGNFGIVTELTLSVTENTPMRRSAMMVSPEDYPAYFDNFLDNPKTSPDLHLYRLNITAGQILQTGFAENYWRLKKTEPGPLVSKLEPEGDRGTLFQRLGFVTVRGSELARKLHWLNEVREAQVAEDKTRNHYLGYPLNFYAHDASKADAEWLQEFFVAKDKYHEFLPILRDTLERNQVNLLNATVRYVKADRKTSLPYAPVDSFAFVIFFNQVLSKAEIAKTAKWYDEIYDALRELDGRYYLPYQPTMTREKFEAIYGAETVQKVRSAKKKYDPQMVFNSVFLQKYLN